ncbi:hypothetical protein T10_5228 [Trichinella papuae]|uniref:Uncharacterized protein n=1 Tax=Trichinella papuae TaxID=268474 RepID=A0A0V1ME69_9BILA|nr:hypothetical protein T10_5228 [Trichinella papuae]
MHRCWKAATSNGTGCNISWVASFDYARFKSPVNWTCKMCLTDATKKCSFSRSGKETPEISWTLFSRCRGCATDMHCWIEDRNKAIGS